MKTQRGCGSRSANSLYVCADTSIFGKDLYFFLVDPPVPWRGSQLRAPMLIEDGKNLNHLALGIGKSFYPYVSDFVEEGRRMGISKKVPRNYDLSGLTPGKSRLLLIHPRAIPQFKYALSKFWCPKDIHEHILRENEFPGCIGDLWSLSGLSSHPRTLKHGNPHLVVEIPETDVSQNHIRIETPSCHYVVNKPLSAKEPQLYSSGIILMFPRFHFEWVGDKAPDPLKKRMEKAGFILELHKE